MENLNPKALKSEARRRLDQAGMTPNYLILLNTGVVVTLGLVVNGLNFLLNHQIGSTGGLGGLGTRSILQTIQTLMSYAVSLFSPFWIAGLLYCFIHLTRGEEVQPRSMLEGFRRFPKILSFSVIEMITAALLFMPVVYLGSFIYMMTPLSAPFISAIEELLQSGAMVTADGMLNPAAIPQEVLMIGVIPVSLILIACAIPVFLFMNYSLHPAVYLLMTDSVRGGFQAFFTSFRLMRGHRWQLLKLDLSYWWYHLLQALAVVVLYSDMILRYAHVDVPMNPTVFYFLTLIAYSAVTLALHYWKKAERDTAFVLAYEEIAAPPAAPTGIAEI